MNWDGLSSLRTALQSEGYTNITNGMSSLSLLNRVYEPGVLVVMGPATPYSMTDTISLITFLARGGSLLVADDYGTGAEIFEPLFDIAFLRSIFPLLRWVFIPIDVDGPK